MSISIIGLGGCGSNIVSQINKSFNGFDFKIIDTNKLQLESSNLEKLNTFSLGSGRGSGMNPALALQLAQNKEKELLEFLKKPELAFLITGAGGTGNGLADFVSNLLIKQNTLPVVFLVKPFDFEDRKADFDNLLNKLKLNNYSYTVISNNNIANLNESLSIDKVYQKSNSVLKTALKTIEDLKNSRAGIDFNDLKTILTYKGYFLANTITAKDWQECFKLVITPELLDFTPESFEGGLIKISSKNLPAFKEVKKVLNNSLLKLKKPQTKFKLGFEKTESEETTVNLILTGINNNIL